MKNFLSADHPTRTSHRSFQNALFREDPILRRMYEESISLLEATLDATQDGILVVDDDGKIVRYNKRFAELWRIPHAVLDTIDDEVVLRYALGQLRDPEAFLGRVRQLYDDPHAESQDELEFQDGRVIERTSKPQYINGVVCGRVWSFTDITEKKKAASKMQELLDCEHRLRVETENHLRLREDFLSIASHEMRTPLTPLTLHLQIFQRFLNQPAVRELPGARKQLELLNRSVEQVNRITRLVEDLLDVSRIATGRLSLSVERFNFSQMVKDVVDRYSVQLRTAGCGLKLSLQPEIIGEWDRLRLEQVLTNLLSNAMKFGACKPIEITAECEREWVTLRVRDHGIGISEKDQKRLFNRFERAVSQKQFGGLGLGLYIVRQILESHGGSIAVESKPQEGSTFVVRIPQHASNS